MRALTQMSAASFIGVFAFLSPASAQVNSVFGVEIDKPVPFRSCEVSRPDGTKRWDMSEPCAAPAENAEISKAVGDTRILIPVAELPSWAETIYARTSSDTGAVESILVVIAKGAQNAEVLSALVRKYGKPTTTHTRVMQNALGARFEAPSAEWKRGTVVVRFSGAATSNERGTLNVLSVAAAARIDSERSTERAKQRPL